MRGFPKDINTKQDVINLLSLYPDETVAFLQKIIRKEELYYWKPVGEVASPGEGVEDETHKVVSMENETDGTVKHVQMELVENPNATVYRLGFSSVSQVEDLINGH